MVIHIIINKSEMASNTSSQLVHDILLVWDWRSPCYNGWDVLGMNSYDKKIGIPFLLWHNICKILESFEEKR